MAGGAVLSQNLTGDAAIQTLANDYQISYGKAALVQKILAENAHLVFEDLAKLSVNELVLLVGSKGIQSDDMEAQGNASDMAYIGDERAKQAALEHAGIGASEAERLHTELDYDDGAMVYEVEFYYSGMEYEYEVNATDGSIMKHDQEPANNENSGTKRDTERKTTPAPDTTDFIGESKAVEIAEAHAGITAGSNVKVELDKDDGLYIYDVDFEAGQTEYDYEINAATGEIVSWEADSI
jgi:uncharacterized membrane protein YkoI